MVQVITRCRLTGHYMFMGMDVDPKEFPRSPGPFARKFCPFCACDHLWHKEDARFVAIKPVSRPRIQQASAICNRAPDGGLRPTKFEFVINLQTAKTIGLAVPPTLLAPAAGADGMQALMGTHENAALFGLLLCLPTAKTVPLNSQDIGTSGWRS